MQVIINGRTAYFKTKTSNGRPALEARYERGMWIVECPFRCGAAFYAISGRPYICGECYYEEAKIACIKQGKRYTEETLISMSRALAKKKGEVFPVVRTKLWKEVERICKPRPKANRNWSPGESLGHLLEENFQHGISFV